MNKFLFIFLATLLAITFFTRSNFRRNIAIQPEVLLEPIQTEPADKSLVQFTRDGYDYVLTPVFDYEISGLVVHTFDYSWLHFYKSDVTFPVDLCMIWGKNIISGAYQHPSLKFSQDSRWCQYRWRGQLDFNGSELSNNHLLIDNDALKKLAKSLSAGDQVKIIGKLVNVEAKGVGKLDTYDPEMFRMNTSTTRTDSGAGACEIIFVEDLIILKKGNPLSQMVFQGSIYGLAVWLMYNIVKLLFFP